jgi:hypothetical protein
MEAKKMTVFDCAGKMSALITMDFESALMNGVRKWLW